MCDVLQPIFVSTSQPHLFQGQTNKPHHFSIPVRALSASFISALILSRCPSTLFNCSPWSLSMDRVLVHVASVYNMEWSISSFHHCFIETYIFHHFQHVPSRLNRVISDFVGFSLISFKVIHFILNQRIQLSNEQIIQKMSKVVLHKSQTTD